MPHKGKLSLFGTYARISKLTILQYTIFAWHEVVHPCVWYSFWLNFLGIHAFVTSKKS